jgi:hypothetical protein
MGEERAGGRDGSVEGDAAEGDSDVPDRLDRGQGLLLRGGSYVGEPGKQIMHGSMYTEVWVPKQIKSPYPMVIFHGNGQTGQDWLYTPDRPQGVGPMLDGRRLRVYMVDYPRAAARRTCRSRRPTESGSTAPSGSAQVWSSRGSGRPAASSATSAKEQPYDVARNRQARRSDL